MTFMTEALQDDEKEGGQGSVPLTQSDQAVYERLWDIDNAYRAAAKVVADHLQAMDKAVDECDDAAICTIKPTLSGDLYGLKECLAELDAIDTLGDDAHNIWKSAIRTSIEELVERLNASGYSEISEALHSADPEMKSVDTCTSALCPLDINYNILNLTVDEYLAPHVHAMHPLILIPMLLVISLNLFSHLSREWCNSTLRALLMYARFAVRDAEHWTSPLQLTSNNAGFRHPLSGPLARPSRSEVNVKPVKTSAVSHLESLLSNFPLDLRTLKDRFGMRAKIEVYAVCPDPKCCAVYSLKEESTGLKTYPRVCSKRHLRNRVEKECGALLCVDGVSEGKSVRVPIKSFPVQDWDDFKARLVVNPLILTLLRRGMKVAVRSQMRDIKDGTRLANLRCKDGKPFMKPESEELRLAWSLSTDWFNPFHNHAAGKRASVGSIAMTCLNLPPTFRYKPEYVFLAGLIPGPDEPKDDLCNNFLDVVVDQLERSYLHGTHYSTTYIFPRGVTERSIVAVFVFDLPGARKCCGMHSHSSKRNFCHLCHLHSTDINNLDVGSWTLRNISTHMADALAWRAEPVMTKKKNMFSRTGVRWSPFLRLPYFHPHQSVIVDGMHNLFLGLARYHVRDFLRIGSKDVGVTDSEDEAGEGQEFGDATTNNIDLQVDFTSGLVGDGYFDSHLIDAITEGEMMTIRSYIASTERPRWHKSPPANLGEASHGKLKADQWRSLMEFDIPVALAQLWDMNSERRQLFHCTMLLAIAMRYATSHVVTSYHITQYKRYMLEYLLMLRKLDPESDLRPNHHEALHIPDFLELYGPMHGWWMFVYERTIGLLQNTNTNFKIGMSVILFCL